MLVKVNYINIIKNKVKVTQLDIDDYGSIIPIKELELNVPQYDDTTIKILKSWGGTRGQHDIIVE